MLELLVVITIIGILAAIVLRQITKAREAGWATQCKANLRTLYQASLNYAVMNNNYGPYAYPVEWSTVSDYGVTTQFYASVGWVTWVRNTTPSNPAAALWPSGASRTALVHQVTCYGQNGQYSIQHGSLWEYTEKSLKSYLCPKFAQVARDYAPRRTDAMRSYVMNASVSGASPLSISTEASRTVLYAELQPWNKDPRWTSSPQVCSASADNTSVEGNNGVLNPGTLNANGYQMTQDSIGFLHQMGGLYCGHVVFCDGHLEAVPLEKVGGSWTNRTLDACNGLF